MKKRGAAKGSGAIACRPMIDLPRADISQIIDIPPLIRHSIGIDFSAAGLRE
jgi:hypothetical protein